MIILTGSFRAGVLPAAVVGAVLLAATWVGAAEGPWTVDDIVLAEEASGVHISPDGARVVWVKGAVDPEAGRLRSNLVLSWIGGRRDEIALTRGAGVSTAPRWSPEGKRIAFLSTRDLPGGPPGASRSQEPQVWLIDGRGGEAWPLTRLDRKVVGFGWRSETSLVFAAAETRSLGGQRPGGDTARAIEDPEETPPVRLFEADVETGQIRRLTENEDWIEWLAVSPDGRWVVARHGRSLSFRFDHQVPPVLTLHDLASGEARPLLEGERALAETAVWAPDSKGFYFVQQYSSDARYFTATIRLLQYVDAETGQAAPVDLHWPNGLGSERVLPTLDGFLALLADGVRFRPARYTRSGSGWTRQDLTGEHTGNLFDWALGQDGRTLVYDHSTASRPTQWYQALLNGGAIEGVTRLTRLNPGFEDKPTPPARVERWTGAQGEEVEGILYYPFDYERGKKYPLVLTIHGGPSSVDLDRWSQGYKEPKVLLAQRGIFVLEANYHGSSNYGLEWVESICCGQYGELEPVDLEAGVDHVIQLGLADRRKLGSMGWSNGAILTTALVTRNARFKAASVGAGDVEWFSDWANVDFGAAFDNYYLGAAPYEDPELYIRKSPFFRLGDVTTPTLLFTGDRDRNVPSGQSWSHFRVMQQASETPVRLVIFTGEAHQLEQYAHQRRKIEEDLAWFDTHLLGRPPRPSAVKAGSLLSRALDRTTFAREGGLYGRRANKGGPLLPEAVEYQGLRVGRFEVTRAQFSVFDEKYTYPEGTGNHPANGLTFERAQAYAAWLAATTGEPWRLPTASETARLRGKPGDGGDENTLDRWAGYSPGPEDTSRLLEEAAALGPSAPLLSEVGRFAPRGPGVFDLAGNVAEWTVGTDGSGILATGSADRPTGASGPSSAPGLEYSGLRVVASPSP